MHRINVGVFPAGTEIGLEINSAIKFSKDINVIGIAGGIDHSAYVYSTIVTGAPYLGEAELLGFMIKAIREHKIEYIFPAHDEACLFLAEHEEELGVKVVCSPFKTARTCRYKSKTYSALGDANFLPKTFNGCELDSIPMPIFIKPDKGQGSKGAQLIDSAAVLGALEDVDSYILCEYLPGKEYTIDCFSDDDSKVLFSGIRQRERIKSGISVASSNLKASREVENIAQVISSKIILKGAWFFQLKEDVKGNLKLMEVACRIAGTMGMYRNKGINFALASLYQARGYDVCLIENNFDLSVDRALISRYKTSLNYKTVYIDFDDTVIFEANVNTDALKFIYQCRNNKIEVFLITRHAGDIIDSLANYAIPQELFSNVIHLTEGERKSDFIEHEDAIFIDDSFAERKDVASKLGIPVFDVDAIEMLISWIN
jgi:hypothetical protein